ncbi:hypothetical protein TKK_0009516 [Trichogramma kaykai]
MLKSTLLTKDDVDIRGFLNLKILLKNNCKGYQPKQSRTLEWNEVERFINKAPDIDHLATKVMLILGICGGLRCEELVNLKIQNVKDEGHRFIVAVYRKKTEHPQEFMVGELFYEKVKKYISLRPAEKFTDRLLIRYEKGECVRQVIGINKIGETSYEVAKHLGLDNPKKYTGHCLRRTAASLLSESGANLQSVRQMGGWRSDHVAQLYIEHSKYNRQKIFDGITHASKNPIPSTSRSREPIPSTSSSREPIPSTSRSREPIPSTSRERAKLISNPVSTESYDLSWDDFSENFDVNEPKRLDDEEKIENFATANGKKLPESKFFSAAPKKHFLSHPPIKFGNGKEEPPSKRLKINKENQSFQAICEGKLKCEKCGIRCKKPSMMKKHLKTHTNLRPFSCKQCCFSFKTKGNLTKHEKSKTHFEHRANFNDKFIRPDSFVFNKEFMSSEDSSSKDGDFTAESTCKKPYNDCMKIQEAAKSLLCLADTTMDHTREPTIRPLTYPYDSNIKNESISNDHPNSLNESFIEKNVNSPIDLRIKQKMEVNLNHKSEPAKVHSSESFNQKMIQAYVTECHLLNDKLKGHCKTISVISENFQPDNFNQHETQELTNYNTFYQHDNITDFVENHTLQQPLQEKPDLRNSVIIRSNESDEMLMKDDSSTVISDPIEADNREILYYNKNENVNVNEPSKSENLIHKLNNLTTNPSLLKSSSIQTKSHFLNSVFVILHTLSNAFSQCYFDNFHIKKDSNT